jgi:hypothetical protein
MRANPKQVGTVTEARVFAALVAEFDTVLLPFGDNSRYDLVVEHRGTFLRVQCKTARLLADGVIQFPTVSSQAHRGGTHQNYVGQVDFFGVASDHDPRIFLVPIARVVSTRAMTLRLMPTPSGRVSNCNFADEYEVSVQAAAIRARLEGASA